MHEGLCSKASLVEASRVELPVKQENTTFPHSFRSFRKLESFFPFKKEKKNNCRFCIAKIYCFDLCDSEATKVAIIVAGVFLWWFFFFLLFKSSKSACFAHYSILTL